jgi:aspartate kinase
MLLRAASEYGVSPRMRDSIAATGELVSSRIVAAALQDVGLPAEWLDARRVIVTNAEHGHARPLMSATKANVERCVRPIIRAGRVPVMGGFVGATPDEKTTTLGRGGSDYSAAIVGACLGAEEIQLWSDVDGMLTADPRLVGSARPVHHLSFAAAYELARSGAKVLHPATIGPADAADIPLRLLNFQRPEQPGTVITRRPTRSVVPIVALACRRRLCVVEAVSPRGVSPRGFLMHILEVFDRFKAPVIIVTGDSARVTAVLDETGDQWGVLIDALANMADVSRQPHMALISAVGEQVGENPAVTAGLVTTLEGLDFRLLSQLSPRIVACVVRDEDLEVAINRLHRRFIGGDNADPSQDVVTHPTEFAESHPDYAAGQPAL